MGKKNITLMLSYLTVLTIVLAGYLFMVALPAEGYNPGDYKQGYLYFMAFQFLLFSLLVPFWEIGALTGGSIKQSKALPQVGAAFKTLFYYLGGLLWQMVILVFASVPLIFIIHIAGCLNIMNFLWPMAIQVLWGMFILSARIFLHTTNLPKMWQYYFLVCLIFAVVVLTLVFFYFYLAYGQLVVTTVFDGDIPGLFFLNPLLTVTGLLYMQIGGGNQVGWAPVVYHLCFCCPVILIFCLLTLRNLKNAYREV
ncbi:hypothetical protein ABDB91_17770 [Desulfoscipio sp. XC116]|uniref:hypothetical protein n=1 Tax=Desulfoscipio sp. XC116 TaxID=3144975 RepID=UPI00325BB295